MPADVGGFSRQDQRELVALLEAATAAAGGDPALTSIWRHVRAVRPGSPESARVLAHAYNSLPRFFRGEYGAKLALTARDGRPLLNHPGSETAAQRFRRLPQDATPAAREQAVAAVHTRRAPQPRQCGDCHRDGDGFIDFIALGYPPPRIHALTVRPVVVEMVERIAAGQPFYLPSFVDRPPERPARQPPESRP